MNPSTKINEKRHTKLGLLLLIGPAAIFTIEQIIIGAIGDQSSLWPIVAIMNVLLLIIFVPGIVFGILLLAKVL
jgi:hypothetical protein